MVTRTVRAFGTASGIVLLTAGLTAGILSSARNGAAAVEAQPPANEQPRYLTPVELALSPDGLKLYVACEDDDSLLAVDLRTERVAGSVRVGNKPKGVAVSPDGTTVYVSNEWSDTVSEIDAETLKVRRTLPTGWGPIGLTTDRSGKVLYVANSIGNDISVLDLIKGTEIKRLDAWRSPHDVALSRDGRFVYVSNLLPHLMQYDEPPVSELTVIDTTRQIVSERVLLPGALELRHIAEAPARNGDFLLVPLMRPKNLGPLIQVDQGWIVTHGMAIIRRPTGSSRAGARSRVTQVLLDDVDQYYAGADGAAFTPDGRYALVTSAEANVVSVIDTARLERRLHELPADQLPNRLDSAREFVVRRLQTGIDPTDILVSRNGRLAYIANRLDDSITVVDIPALRVKSKIDLGGPKEITALREGERMFHAASFSFQGQLACASCHPDNHIDGVSWNLETPQLGRDRVANRTLRGIAETAPYKWNGHNPDLETQCGPRIAKYLFRSQGFNHEQLESLVAFIKSIPLPPNRHVATNGRLTPAQERGKAIFYDKGCTVCHTPETHYTNKTSEDVGTANEYDTSGLFDTPQLERVYEKPPYLHNGQALTLEEIWTRFNSHDKHGVTSDMTKEQLNDLIEFLKTL
ncbi:MAG TPA: c-type cytochrome [Candidatus Acidoferrum sp.]|nr:c-type cytochrome [Candidatus Acidoferrum sp.]